MTIELIFVAITALALGALIAWLFASRATGLVRTSLASSEARLSEYEKRLALAEVVERERDDFLRDLTDLRGRSSEREAAVQASHDRAMADREALGSHFADLSAKALESAQRQFLDRADERFKQSEETAGQGLKALLQPVHERLTRYEDSVNKTEAERQSAFGALQNQIETMRADAQRVSGEAAKLVSAFRSAPKARGSWGEQQLRNVLETCGLTEHADFQTEVSVDGEGGRLRPDVIINIPGGKTLVVDSKVSFTAYQDASDAVDDIERKRHMASHAASMKAHVNSLGNKRYQEQFGDGLDFVVMFVGGEHFLNAALDEDPKLWDYAFERRVLLATPTNLIAIARTVAGVWRQEKLARDARQIGELGKELYERLAVAASHLRVVGSGLSTAVGNYNKFVGSFERNVLSTGRKFKELSIESGSREIDEIQPIEALARYGDDGITGDTRSSPLLAGEGQN